MKSLSAILLLLFLLMTNSVLAHQPRIVRDNFVEVTNPEVSQAFYGELRGTHAEYRINSDREFRLYIGILVPDIPGVRKDVSAEIYRLKDKTKEAIAILDGGQFKWVQFYERFARDNYYWGPEYTADDSQKGVLLKGRLVQAGDYRIKVFSPINQGKYAIAIGDAEEFPLKEILSALSVVPQLKLKFFNEPILKVILSPFVWGYILICYTIAFVVGFALRGILKIAVKYSIRGFGKNIGKPDRLLRLFISVALLVWAIATTWNPILLFLSGFTLFEAIFSWCGFYAILGKNTCQLR